MADYSVDVTTAQMGDPLRIFRGDMPGAANQSHDAFPMFTAIDSNMASMSRDYQLVADATLPGFGEGFSPGQAYGQGSVNIDTGSMEGSINMFELALRKVSDVLSDVARGVQSIGSVVGGAFGGDTGAHPFMPDMAEAGRYFGRPKYTQSAMGAFGFGGSPFVPSHDYQQMMSRDFSERTTLLGGAVASAGAEVGGGYLGSKLLAPLFGKGMFGMLAGGIGGYMAAAYPLGHLMSRANQSMELNTLIGDVSSRAGINEGGHGFNRGSKKEIARGIRESSRELNLGMGDFADIMQYGSQSGVFRGVTDAGQFEETVKVAAKNLKILMKVMREPDVGEAIREMSVFRDWGIPVVEQPSFARHASAVGRMLGTTTQGAMQIASMGAQTGPQFGFSMAYGAESSLFGAQVGESMLRSGAMSRAELSLYGGAEAFGKQFAEKSMQSVGRPEMKYALAAFVKRGRDGETLETDKDAVDRFWRGEIGFDEIKSMTSGKFKTDRDLMEQIKYNPQRVAEEAGVDSFQLKEISSKLLEDHYQQRSQTRPGLTRFASYSSDLGSARDAEEHIAYRESRPELLRGMDNTSRQEWKSMSYENRRTSRSLLGRISRGIGKAVEAVDAPFNYAGDVIGRAALDMKRGVTDFSMRRLMGVEYTDLGGQPIKLDDKFLREHKDEITTKDAEYREMSRVTGRFAPALMAEDTNRVIRNILGSEAAQMGEDRPRMDYLQEVITAGEIGLREKPETALKKGNLLVEKTRGSGRSDEEVRQMVDAAKLEVAMNNRSYSKYIGRMVETDISGTAYGGLGGPGGVAISAVPGLDLGLRGLLSVRDFLVSEKGSSETLDLRGELPELPESYSRDKVRKGWTDKKHKEMVLDAARTGKSVPGMVTKGLDDEISGAGATALSRDRAYMPWTYMFDSPGEKLMDIKKDMAPMDFYGGIARVIDVRQGESKFDDLSPVQRKMYDRFKGVSDMEMGRIESTLHEGFDILGKKEYSDLIGKQVAIDNMRISPQTQADQLMRDVDVRTETIGAEGAGSESLKATIDNTVGLKELTTAVRDNTSATRGSKQRTLYSDTAAAAAYIAKKIHLTGSRSNEGNTEAKGE